MKKEKLSILPTFSFYIFKSGHFQFIQTIMKSIICNTSSKKNRFHKYFLQNEWSSNNLNIRIYLVITVNLLETRFSFFSPWVKSCPYFLCSFQLFGLSIVHLLGVHHTIILSSERKLPYTKQPGHIGAEYLPKSYLNF